MVKRVFLIGYMGSGKTTIGKTLAHDLGWRFIDMDTHFEKKHQCTISEFFAAHGENGFRTAEAEVVRELADEQNAVIATGGGAPCFHGNMDVMNHAGLTIYISVEPKDLAKRLAPAKAHRPLIANKTDEELEAFIAEQLQKREEHYRHALMVVDGEHLPFTAYRILVETFPEDEIK